jgi:hypothetical protein
MTIAHQIQEDGNILGTSKRSIYEYSHHNKRKYIGKFPFSSHRDFFGFSRLLSRAMRIDKNNVFRNSNGSTIGIRGGIVYSVTEQSKMEPLFEIQGDCVLHRSISEDNEGWSYIGEYFVNPRRNTVHIYRLSPDLKTWEIAYKFPAGSIRHVHSIVQDPFDENSLWITVGDYAGECFVLQTKDRFSTVTSFGTGEQIWRAVTLFFTESHISWITDTHLEQNHACRMDRNSGQLDIGQKFDCSNWYGCTTQEGLHVAFTTVEKGPGIKRNESSIYISEDAFNWHEIYSYKKDRYRPFSVFKNGVISCPSGTMSLDNFYISGEGLIGLDGSSACLKITVNG